MIERPKLFSVFKPGRVKGWGASKERTRQPFLTACRLLGVRVLMLMLMLMGGSRES